MILCDISVCRGQAVISPHRLLVVFHCWFVCRCWEAFLIRLTLLWFSSLMESHNISEKWVYQDNDFSVGVLNCLGLIQLKPRLVVEGNLVSCLLGGINLWTQSSLREALPTWGILKAGYHNCQVGCYFNVLSHLFYFPYLLCCEENAFHISLAWSVLSKVRWKKCCYFI